MKKLLVSLIALIVCVGIVKADIFRIDDNGAVFIGDKVIVRTATVVVCANNSLDKQQCDYVCNGVDDNVEIQTALDIGKEVKLMDGNFILSDKIYPNSTTTLKGTGWSTVLQTTNDSYIVVEGKSEITIKDLKLTFTGINNSFGIYINSSQDIKVSNVRVEDTYGFGVFINAGTEIVTERITIEDSYLNGLGHTDVIGGGSSNSIYRVKEVFIKNNIVVQNATYNEHYGNAIDMVRVYRTEFINNITEGGILFGSEQDPSTHSIIQGNTVKNAIGLDCAVIASMNRPEATNDYEYTIISGNTLENAYIYVIANNDEQQENFIVGNNVIDATGCTNGILIQKAKGGIITNNVVKNASDTGIKIYRGNHLIVSNNLVRDNYYGIKEVESNNNSYTGNKVFDNNVNYSVSASETVIKGNMKSDTVESKNFKIVGTDDNYYSFMHSANTSPNQDFHFFADYSKQINATSTRVMHGYNGEISSYGWYTKWDGTNKRIMNLSKDGDLIELNSIVVDDVNLLDKINELEQRIIILEQ